MLHLKKYFTEGLIQIAILLSLCGVRVDVGLGPYLPLSWQDMILGPASALTQTQFHNLRNSLEDGHHLHPKSVDLDNFFTARRLLGWVNSLDRLQVPHAELETWLVQREPDPFPMGCPDQPSPLERDPASQEREQMGSAVEPGGGAGARQEEELRDVGATRADLEPHQLGREPELCPTVPNESPCLDLEIHWQDLFAIMQPENTDLDMTTSPEHTPYSRPYKAPLDAGSGALLHLCPNLEANQEVRLMETPLQHGLLGSVRQSELEHVLLPLIPSAQLDDQSPAFISSNVNSLHRPPDHTGLLAENTSMGERAVDNWNAFNMNLLAPDFADDMEDSPSSQCANYSENFTDSDANFHPCDLTASSSASSQEGNDETQDFLKSPSRTFTEDKDLDVGDEDDLHSLLEDIVMLDDIRLLDLALDEAFSPELAARLEQEDCLDCDRVRTERKTDEHSVCSVADSEDQSQPRLHQEGEDEAETDSGLSLDFRHSPTSPCDSEASSYSSSSSSLSQSSLSSLSVVESLSSKDSDDDAVEAFADSDMEVEVTIKQEEEEGEMGAVGGWCPESVKKVFPVKYEDHELFNGFDWQEHIDHDHTYNQRWSQASSPPSTKHIISSPQQPDHYSSYRRITKTSVWGRDAQRAQALKIPFSSELIINLPVDDFNNLLTDYQLSEEQVTLIKDIRRRGKNKIAAQNCRKRKLGVLLGLEDEVSCLTSHRLWLLREKREALKKLQEMKRQLGTLYQEVFSRLRDEDGRPLSTSEYLLHFGPNGSVTVATHQHEALLHTRRKKTGRKQKDKKK